MALTPELQQMVDIQVEIRSAEGNRQRKLEALRIAQAILLENKKTLPVDARQITPEEVTAFADTLTRYIIA